MPGAPYTASTIPAALDALLQVVRLALPEDVQLVEGPPITTDQDLVMMAFGGEPGAEAVTVVRRRADFGGSADLESYDIVCLASCWRGDTDPGQVRTLAFGLLNVIAAELARDRTLGRTVARAYLSVGGIAPIQDSKGARCTIRFVVHVDAFTDNDG